jgi:hypothetical protein
MDWLGSSLVMVCFVCAMLHSSVPCLELPCFNLRQVELNWVTLPYLHFELCSVTLSFESASVCH